MYRSLVVVALATVHLVDEGVIVSVYLILSLVLQLLLLSLLSQMNRHPLATSLDSGFNLVESLSTQLMLLEVNGLLFVSYER